MSTDATASASTDLSSRPTAEAESGDAASNASASVVSASVNTSSAADTVFRAGLVGLLSQLSDASGVLRQIMSPEDGTVLGGVPTHSLDDLGLVVHRSRIAQKGWAATPLARRKQIVRTFARLVLDAHERILDVIQAETGKSRVHALEEVLDVALLSGFYAGRAEWFLRPRRRPGAIPFLTSTRELRHPKGLVGIISPWNYPFTLALSDAIPALLAGNSVVLKPDSLTPYSALIGVQLLREAGLPRDVMQLVIGSGDTIGAALIDTSDFVMFTGSTATGRIIAQQCAARLVGYSAELGGKNPLIVLADADINAAARGAARACFSNAGQLCVSVERIYVQREVARQFTDAFVAATRALKVGVGREWSIDVGSLVSATQLKRVESDVADAVAAGATVLTGGKARPDLGPFVYEPTVLTGVPGTARLAREETFGPVVSIYEVADEAEAVARANDSDYGLNASLWTRRVNARTIASQLHTGTVNINEGYAAAWASHASPMGGWKQSGVSRRHGAEGIQKYTETQTIARQYLFPVGPWPGMSNEAYRKAMVLATRLLARRY